MTPQAQPNTDEVQIHKLIEDRLNSVRARDIDSAVASVAADVLSFDVVNPLQYAGRAALRARAEEWFSSFDGPIGLEVKDLTVAANGDVGFSHCLNQVSATTRDGKKLEMWWRSTVCYRKIEGRWLVTHEHNSVPFDPKTGKASLELKP